MVVLGKIKNYALLAAAVLIVGLAVFASFQGYALRLSRETASRLAENQSSLLTDLKMERNKSGYLQATVQALKLEREEIEALIPKYEAQLDDMRIRLKEAQSIAELNLQTELNVTAGRDTAVAIPSVTLPGVVKPSCYVYNDKYASVNIAVNGDSSAVYISIRDVVYVVAHRERKTCLLKKPKITKYTATTLSPYTNIVGVRYVEVTD